MKVYIRSDIDSEHRLLDDVPFDKAGELAVMVAAVGFDGEGLNVETQFFDDGNEAGFEIIYGSE